VAFTIGINKDQNTMMKELLALMVAEGWERTSPPTISNIVTSRGYTYSGTAIASPGRYSDTVGVTLLNNIDRKNLGLSHTQYTSKTFPDGYFADTPTEFSVSYWAHSKGYSKLATVSDPPADGHNHKQVVFAAGGYLSTTYRIGFSINSDPYFGFTSNAGVKLGGNFVVEDYFTDEYGETYQHFCWTVSNTNKTVKLYINGVLVNTSAFNYFVNYNVNNTVRPVFFGFYGGGTDITMDEFIVWNKVLSDGEILTLSSRSTKVEANEPFVFEKFTNYVQEAIGGWFTNVADDGSDVNVRIEATNNNNILLSSGTLPVFPLGGYGVSSIPTSLSPVYKDTNLKYLAGSSTVGVYKKYWLVVDNNKVIISTKLEDITTARQGPLYQTAYLGKLLSGTYTGGSVLVAGTTVTSTYSWITESTSSFISGLTYGTNASISSLTVYTSPTVGGITTGVNSFTPLNSSVFLQNIFVNSSSNLLGIVDGVYLVSTNSANPEDIITIGADDYVLLKNSDSLESNGLLCLRLK